MRFVHVALLLAVTTSPALAQREPQIVIPGRRDVGRGGGRIRSRPARRDGAGRDLPAAAAVDALFRAQLLPQGRQEARLWPVGNQSAAGSAAATFGANLL